MRRISGFTIIELAIVITVIGILSGIVFVSYVGIQGQVQTETAKTYALQASKKLLSYSADNGGVYPDSLSVVGLTDGPSTKYQYTYDNVSSPKTYCLTVTNNTKSAYISKGQSAATAGACVGHGVDGQAPPTLLAAPSNFSVYWQCGFIAQWDTVPAATSYVLQYDDASNFATPVGTINNVTSGTTHAQLTGGQYARVAAVGVNGQGYWTPAFFYGPEQLCS